MMVGLPGVLLVIACLLVVVSAVQKVARRLLLPETVLLAVVGVIIGGGADWLLHTPRVHLFDRAARTVLDLPIDSDTILLVFLPILVFAGSLAIEVRRLLHDTAAVLTLAIVAVLASTAAIGLGLLPFAHLPLSTCLLLGAIVANTDPSAVAAIFRDVGAAGRLTRLVEGEALLNDAAAISIFGVLVAAIDKHQSIELGSAASQLVVSFAGAGLIGIALGRATLLLITLLGETVAGEVTLTLALPFIAYIVCQEGLHLSGVVAVAASGLTISMFGPSTLRPPTWRFLAELWEQLAFWAGSLVFVLAAMLVPRMLLDATAHDLLLIGIVVAASLVARGAVLFGLLPLLSAARVARPVPNAYKTVMLWGGLRGAITLALVLAVTDSPSTAPDASHVIGTVATGFVFFTLLVNGTTLRPLVVRLGLDRLSPRDQLLKRQVLAIGLEEIRDRARGVAEELGFSTNAVRHVVGQIEHRAESEQDGYDFESAIGDRDRIALALVTVAARERALLVEQFRFRGLSRGVAEHLLRTADAMVDGALHGGRSGFMRAARGRLRPTPTFWLAQILHLVLRFDAPLVSQMTARYEILLVSHLLATRLQRFMQLRIEPMLGGRVAEIVSEVLERRQEFLNQALEAMRLHYGGYAEALESRVLRMLALRIENEEYDALRDESLIGEELHHELIAGVEKRRRRLERRLRFNIASGIDERLRALAVFEGVPDAILHDLVMTVSVRFAVAGETLLRRGRRPRFVYIISSGELEQRTGDEDIRLRPGEIAGGREALRQARLVSSVRCVTFGHLLTVRASEFRRFVQENPVVERNLGTAPAPPDQSALRPDPAGDSAPGSAMIGTAR